MKIYSVTSRVMGRKSFHGWDDTKETLERYLYDHTKLISFEQDKKNLDWFVAVIQTSAISILKMEYYASYQAGRLLSGNYGVTIESDSLQEIDVLLEDEILV